MRWVFALPLLAASWGCSRGGTSNPAESVPEYTLIVSAYPANDASNVSPSIAPEVTVNGEDATAASDAADALAAVAILRGSDGKELSAEITRSSDVTQVGVGKESITIRPESELVDGSYILTLGPSAAHDLGSDGQVRLQPDDKLQVRFFVGPFPTVSQLRWCAEEEGSYVEIRFSEDVALDSGVTYLDAIELTDASTGEAFDCAPQTDKYGQPFSPSGLGRTWYLNCHGSPQSVRLQITGVVNSNGDPLRDVSGETPFPREMSFQTSSSDCRTAFQ